MTFHGHISLFILFSTMTLEIDKFYVNQIDLNDPINRPFSGVCWLFILNTIFRFISNLTGALK